MQFVLGLVASMCTTGAFVPQTVATLRSPDTQGVSITTYIVLGVGVLLWTVYGLFARAVTLVAANVITLTLIVIVLVSIFRRRRQKRELVQKLEKEVDLWEEQHVRKATR